MAIRLDNFEKAVEPTIVQRGRTYFLSAAQPNATSPHDSKLTNRSACHHLSDELFAKLPREDFDKHIMALCLIHDGLIDKGHLTRLAKSAQLTVSEATERQNFLFRRRWIEMVDFRDRYRLRTDCVLATAMYVLDRHPQWLTAELMNVRQIPSNIMNFWHVCAALYDEDIDFLKRQRISSTSINQNVACWQVAFCCRSIFRLRTRWMIPFSFVARLMLCVRWNMVRRFRKKISDICYWFRKSVNRMQMRHFMLRSTII